MRELQRALAGSPRALLQRLAEVALELCAAHSAGVSLLEEADGRRVFRWHAVAGRWAELVWSTLPRDGSPCGTVLDRRAALLMIDPERHFAPLGQLSPPVVEALLVPFGPEAAPVGTVWVISHEAGRRFDREDRRIVTALTRFAADAYARLRSLSRDHLLDLSRLHRESPP